MRDSDPTSAGSGAAQGRGDDTRGPDDAGAEPIGQTSLEIDAYLDKIATRLRAWRSAQGMTLQQVASRSGVAASTIQKVESQQMVPTIAVLFKIARGLGRSPVDLLDDASGLPEVFHRSSSEDDADAATTHKLTGRLANAQLSTWRVRHGPGEGAEAPHLGPRGEVLIICESGRLEASVGERTFTLEPGDSLHCKTRQGLGWRATGDGPAEFMVIGTEALGLERVLGSAAVRGT